MVVPSSAEKGGSNARTSPTRSSSRGQEEHRHVEPALMAPEVPTSGAIDEIPAALEPAISQVLATTSAPPTPAPPLPGSSAPDAVLERALSEMTQL